MPTFRLRERDGNYYIYDVVFASTEAAEQIISFGAIITQDPGVLLAKSIDIEGSQANALGPITIRNLATAFGRFCGVNRLTVIGRRTTGAKPGKVVTLRFRTAGKP